MSKSTIIKYDLSHALDLWQRIACSLHVYITSAVRENSVSWEHDCPLSDAKTEVLPADIINLAPFYCPAGFLVFLPLFLHEIYFDPSSATRTGSKGL